jgi:hypothetical protein
MSASNGKEVKSALRYGQHVVRMANPGGKGLRFRKSSPGTCRGDVLGKATVELALGGDWVVVLTRFSPKKVVVWDALEAGLARIALRNGADLGTFGFKWAVPELEEPWFPVPVLTLRTSRASGARALAMPRMSLTSSGPTDLRTRRRSPDPRRSHRRPGGASR